MTLSSVARYSQVGQKRPDHLCAVVGARGFGVSARRAHPPPGAPRGPAPPPAGPGPPARRATGSP